MFTIPAQRQLPNLVVASPKDEQELRSLLRTAFAQEHPFALHYPRDPGFGLPEVEPRADRRSARARCCARATTSCSSASARSSMRALEVADALARGGWSVGVVNARFAKPLDRQLILDQARGKRLVVTFEESVVDRRLRQRGARGDRGGAADRPGAARASRCRPIGIPADRFVDHGAVADLRRMLRLDVPGPHGAGRASAIAPARHHRGGRRPELPGLPATPGVRPRRSRAVPP